MRSQTTQVLGITIAPPFQRGARAGRQRLAIAFSAQSTENWPELPSPLKSDPQNVKPPPPHPLSPWDIILPVPLTSSLSYFPEGSPGCSGHSSPAPTALRLYKIGQGARERACAPRTCAPAHSQRDAEKAHLYRWSQSPQRGGLNLLPRRRRYWELTR